MLVVKEIFQYGLNILVLTSCLYFVKKLLLMGLQQHKVMVHMSQVPHFKYWPVISYWKRLYTTYQKTKEFPPSNYILEVLSGANQVFLKEKIFLYWVMHRPMVFVCNPKHVEAVMSRTDLIEKGYEYRFLHPWLGTGLLTSGGDKWRKRRKLLTPTFHFRILEDFVSVFNEQSFVLINKMKECADKKWVDIVPLITMCTLDIICQSTMGVRIHAQSNPEDEYVKAVYELGDSFLYRVSRPWLWVDAIFYLFPRGRKFRQNVDILHTLTRKVIKEKKEELLQLKKKEKQVETSQTTNESATSKKKKAFLELLLELHIENNSLSEEDIREEVDTFMFEGHDTTAMAICWCLYNVGLYPDVQEKVFEEIEEIFADDKERPVTTDDIRSMKYLECVLKEILGSNVLIEKADEYKFLHPWLNTGLLTSGGEKWRTRRKLLTPSFHFRILEDFISVFNEQSDVLVKKMKQVSHKEWVDIVPLITMCALDIICNSTMGICINAQNNPESEYVRAIHEIGDQFYYRASRPWLWIDAIYYRVPSGMNFQKCLNTVHGLSRNVIKEKKKELLEAKRSPSSFVNGETTTRKKRKAFLEMLLEHHINDNSLSEEDIREEVDTFMFEGHDTIAMALCWCLYNIGLYSNVQEKVYQEIEAVFADDKERPVTSDDIKAMKYMECVLKEGIG